MAKLSKTVVKKWWKLNREAFPLLDQVAPDAVNALMVLLEEADAADRELPLHRAAQLAETFTLKVFLLQAAEEDE